MKKLNLFILLIIAACQLSQAQTTTINGVVRDDKGNPVQYAFVHDDQFKNAAFTDVSGSFKLAADPSSKISVSCDGYDDASVNAAGNTNPQIVLKANGSPAGKTEFTGDAKLLLAAFTNENNNTGGSGIGFGGVPVFNDAKQTVGHRFLYTAWVHGYMVKADGGMVQGKTTLFNYDKIKGDVFLTTDNNTVTLADKNVIKAFTLYGPDNKALNFEKMTGISDDHYSQVISSGSKYKIYKLTTTKFVAANFKSNGLTSTGSPNNEFVDDNTFHVLDLKTNNFQQLTLKKKSIKDAFPNDADKVNSFMSSHSGKIDEDYLKELGDTLNQ